MDLCRRELDVKRLGDSIQGKLQEPPDSLFALKMDKLKMSKMLEKTAYINGEPLAKYGNHICTEE
jgi:hypothetical protein